MDFGALLSAYGLPGIIIFALGLVVVRLDQRVKDLTDKLFTVQEQRRVETLETAKELSQTMLSFSQATQLLIDKVQIVRGEK